MPVENRENEIALLGRTAGPTYIAISGGKLYRRLPDGWEERTNNGNWTRAAVYTSGLAAGAGFLGVTAFVNADNTVTIVGTTTESPARLLAYTDDGVNTAPTPVVVATAAANTAFRGVVVAPVQ